MRWNKKSKNVFWWMLACLASALVGGVIVWLAQPASVSHRALLSPKNIQTKIPQPKQVKKPLKPSISKAKLAIILDDWGMKESNLDEAIELGKPITLSVLPHLPHSASIARKAHANGLGLMLHLPMQPKNLKDHLEPSTITVDMANEKIISLLDHALSSVPLVEGVNNHMGSQATSDERVMRTLLSHLEKKGLFFIDSNTIRTTVGPKIAQETGVLFAIRDVFIDNNLNLSEIKSQLQKAANLALTHGHVVAIGHDHAVTLKAIGQMLPTFETMGVELVYARQMVS